MPRVTRLLCGRLGKGWSPPLSLKPVFSLHQPKRRTEAQEREGAPARGYLPAFYLPVLALNELTKERKTKAKAKTTNQAVYFDLG